MLRLPVPMPADPELEAFVEARYDALPDEREGMQTPRISRGRDGVLVTLHMMFQNQPMIFLGGWFIAAAALGHLAWRAFQSLFL